MKIHFSIYICIILLASGCHIRLLPEFTPARKFTSSFSMSEFENTCTLSPLSIYFSGALVSDPFQGKRVVVESESGELVFFKSVEWGARFEDLLGRSFEDGLRVALGGYTEVRVLSPESGAESDFDIGIHLTGNSVRDVGGKESRNIKSTAIFRIYRGMFQDERYYILSAESPLSDLTEDSYVHAIRSNVKMLSTESYTKLLLHLCEKESSAISTENESD
jgi:ABC-type uncharacterized transport system auxiliary subunit